MGFYSELLNGLSRGEDNMNENRVLFNVDEQLFQTSQIGAITND